MKNIIKKLSFVFLLCIIIHGCGYKLGGLEVIGSNSSKTASIKILSSKSLLQSFINSGFIIDNQNFSYFIETEGPYYKKETTSVTSSATENEFTITGTVIISISNKDGKYLINSRMLSFSKDHKFSSSSINSSDSEENIIREDIRKYLEIQIINLVRNNI